MRVRLCFEVESSASLTGLEEPILIEAPGVTGAWCLKQVVAPSQLSGQRLDLRSPCVDSKETALLLGRRAQAALMAVALRRGLGAILSERLPRGRLFDVGRRLLAGDRFDELLDDNLGLTVYEDAGRVGFVGIPPVQFQVASPAARVLSEWSDALAGAVPASEPVSVSFDLWSSSRSESSSRARLLLLVMAIEALVQQQARSSSEVALVEEFLTQVRTSSLHKDSKDRLCSGLSLLRREGIGTSCHAAVAKRLGGDAGKTFRTCYRLRNVIAHGGQAPDVHTLVNEANQLEPIVKTFLLDRLAA